MDRARMDDGIQIDLTLRHHEDDEQEVRMSFFIVARVDGQFSHLLDIEQAVNADASSFMHDLPSSHQQVLSSEILAGLLTGKRRDKDRQRGWHVELRALGSHRGESRNISDASSVAFAVGASLAMSHACGAENLETNPHGGHDWDLVAFTVGAP